MIIRYRPIAEIMLEDIFVSPKNWQVCVDYRDIQRIRQKHTLSTLHSYQLDLSELNYMQSIAGDTFSLDGINYCVLEISCNEVLKIHELLGIINSIHEVTSRLPQLNCIHISKDLDCDEILVNIFLFAPKIENDTDEDYMVEQLTEAYRKIRNGFQDDYKACEGDLMCFSSKVQDMDPDSRLASYTSILKYLEVNEDSATFVNDIVEEAISRLEEDIKAEGRITIPTLLDFDVYADLVWVQLEPYYTERTLKPISTRWKRILRREQKNSPGYIESISMQAKHLKGVPINTFTSEEFYDILIWCSDSAIKGNDTNRADIFSALEHLSRMAHSFQDHEKCIVAAKLCVEIGMQENQEILFREERVRALDEMISCNMTKNDSQK